MLWDDLNRWNVHSIFQDFDRLHTRFNRLRSGSTAGNYPSVNLYVNGETATLTAEVPGVKSEDLDISVQNDALILAFTRESEKVEKGASLRQERSHGRVSRHIKLPFRADANQVDAKLSNGVLRVELPRAEADKPRKIGVKVAAG